MVDFEHINEDTIRVHIRQDDLKAHGFSILDLLKSRENVEEFFQKVLREVDVDRHFEGSEAVTFQVIPNIDGLELLISKGDDLPEDLISTLHEMYETGYHDAHPDREVLEMDEETDEIVLSFNRLEDIISLAKVLYQEAGNSVLYESDGILYLHLVFYEDDMQIRLVEEEIAIALEFGQLSQMTPALLQEYGKILIAEHALEEIRFQF